MSFTFSYNRRTYFQSNFESLSQQFDAQPHFFYAQNKAKIKTERLLSVVLVSNLFIFWLLFCWNVFNMNLHSVPRCVCPTSFVGSFDSVGAFCTARDPFSSKCISELHFLPISDQVMSDIGDIQRRHNVRGTTVSIRQYY